MSEQNKTKEERMLDFIRVTKAYDLEIAEIRESKKETKASYVENGWLTKEEIKLGQKVVKLIDDDVELLDVERIWKMVEGSV